MRWRAASDAEGRRGSSDEFRRGERVSVRVTNPQEDVVSKTQTRISKVGTVVIPVSDQDRAIEFYVATTPRSAVWATRSRRCSGFAIRMATP
jgi:hypothetical protein